MNRDKFLLILGQDPTRWAERYDIEPFTAPCSKCGKEHTTIPFIIGQLRGLTAPPCSCGNKYTPYCLVRDARYGDLLTGGCVAGGETWQLT